MRLLTSLNCKIASNDSHLQSCRREVMEQFVVFESNNQSFAVDIPQVEKIIEAQEFNKIPDSSDFLLGYIQYNGKVLPVIDLKTRLYNSKTEAKKENKIIVIHWKNGNIGLLVERIEGIKRFNQDQYEESNSEYQLIKEYIMGFLNTDKGTTIILNTDKVFTPEQEDEILEAQCL